MIFTYHIIFIYYMNVIHSQNKLILLLNRKIAHRKMVFAPIFKSCLHLSIQKEQNKVMLFKHNLFI